MTGDNYAGNVCVTSYDNKKDCGCNSNSDCKSGYHCNAAMLMCVKDDSSCSATECKAATGIYYFGNVCIDDGYGGKMCGCTKNSECNSGYTCDVDTCVNNSCSSDSGCAAGYVCDNGTCKKPTGCSSDSGCAAGYVCDNGTCVKATESNPVKIVFTNGGTCEKIMAKSTGITKCECTDTSDACSTNKYKKLAITFDNGVVMKIASGNQLYSAKNISLKKGDGSKIEITNMKKLSTVDFTMQFPSDIGPSKVKGNPILVTDSNGNKQQFFGIEDKASTPVTRQYKLSGTAQMITMEHETNTTYDQTIYVNDIQITAP